MKFRSTSIWVALISTGTLCLAVGAVRIPRKPEATDSPSQNDVESPAASVIPMRISPSAQSAGASTTSAFTTQPTMRRREDFTRQSPREFTADNQFGAAGAFVDSSVTGPVAAQRPTPGSFQEPEPWPFHRTTTDSSSRSVNRYPVVSAGQENSQVADWPYQRSNYQRVDNEPFHATTPADSETVASSRSIEQFPFSSPTASSSRALNPVQNQSASGVAGNDATSSDLLNPGLSFGVATGPASSGGLSDSYPQSNRQPVLTNAPVQQPRVAPSLTSPTQPSLTNLPAPHPSPGQSQIVLEAGHAGPNSQVIQAYAESVTPRNYVTVGQWAGPQRRPVRSIQQVSFDSCPDCEDVQRIPAESLINPYAARANGYPDSAALPRQNGQLVELPRDYAPWWEEVINRPMRAAPSTHPVNVESLILAAIEYSPQVTAFRIDPIIRETQILEEAAEFDWKSFIETKFDDSNDPIGNTLTTGDNSDRFTDRHLTSRLGLEKRLAQGGSVDLTQNFGLQENNSTFFTPRDQGTSRLELNFTQPLLRGAGQTYNESRTVLAMLDHQISEDDLRDSLQDHLLEVYTTYWNLYRARAVRLQKERLLVRAIEVEQKLTARQGIDSVRRQVLRARAAIASRRSEIARADMEVRNAESRLRLLVNSPGLKQNTVVELLPVEAPMSEYLTVSMRGSVETALQNRPDIRRAITQMKETAVRLEVSKNELLPKLDLVLGTYVAGLRGRSQVDTAWTEQFTEGRPGYTVGLMLQYPLGNRAAKARYARREWEVARTLKEFEASVEASMSEVELAVREFETSYQEMLARFQAMIAADTEANYLLERWRLLPGNDQTTSFLLEDVLDAQERVAAEEQDFVEAQVAYVISVVRLKRASGILLSCDCGNSPVSFMTPAPRGIAQPRPLSQPDDQRPILPEPAPVATTLPDLQAPQPEQELSADQQPVSRSQPPQPTTQADDGPSIIPLPAPAR